MHLRSKNKYLHVIKKFTFWGGEIEVYAEEPAESLEPDYVCSVTELSKYFNENEFDTVLCAEVLEHIPFEYFEKALKELWKVSKRYVIISLPHFGIGLSLSLKIPLVRLTNFTIKIPFPVKHVFDGQHYWEIGKKEYPLRKILKIISKWYHIEKNIYGSRKSVSQVLYFKGEKMKLRIFVKKLYFKIFGIPHIGTRIR